MSRAPVVNHSMKRKYAEKATLLLLGLPVSALIAWAFVLYDSSPFWPWFIAFSVVDIIAFLVPPGTGKWIWKRMWASQ